MFIILSFLPARLAGGPV